MEVFLCPFGVTGFEMSREAAMRRKPHLKVRRAKRDGAAILSPRPKRICCELPKGSQLFYALIATAARAFCCRGLAAFDFG